MGKKRKQNVVGPPDGALKPDEQTKFGINEDFADSEDEFFAERDHILVQHEPSTKRRKVHKDDEFLQPSDEEVLGYDDDDSISNDDDLGSGSAESGGDGFASNRETDEDGDDNLQDWGPSKADYYNADIIETEADALEEEQEARRLQQKHLQNLTEADFGFDEYRWTEEDTAGDGLQRDHFMERLPELEVNEDASPEEKVQILKSRYPEFEPLAKDFLVLQTVHKELSLAASAVEAVVERTGPPKKARPGAVAQDSPAHKSSIATIKLRALSAYLGTIGMYFALLTSPTKYSSRKLAMSPSELRDHPIVHNLFRSRQLWEAVKDVAVPDVEVTVGEADTKGMEEAASKMNDASTEPATNGDITSKKKRRSKAERAAIKAQDLTETERQLQIQKTEAKLAELDALMLSKRREGKRKATAETSSRQNDADSEFGDEDALTAQEKAEKAHRKNSLRFYTSQIAQKSNKRGAASREAGGDTDLPYKERLKDRQARLMREAELRGRSEAGKAELGGSEASDDDGAEEARLAQEIRGDDDPDQDGYYDLISTRTQHKKDNRKALAEAQARAAKEGGQVHIAEEIGPDGKRAISYAIEKNKGLAPRRKKEVRNPRVKKKIRYEQKLKKLGSIRQVYRGEREGKGGYAGELTGIKTNVLKGVKL